MFSYSYKRIYIYLTSYRLLFTTGSFTLTASPFSSEPDVQRVQRVRTEG